MYPIVGTWHYVAGTSGTPTLPKGSVLIAIWAHAATAGAYFTIAGGDHVPVPALGSTPMPFPPDLAATTTSDAVVFSGTDAYYILYLVKP